MTRRRFLALSGAGVPAAAVADATVVEPYVLRVVRLRLRERPRVRLVHFTDVHYKGDQRYLERVVRRINELHPDFACFTGDFIEEARFLDPALDILAGVQCPVFAVPGNHDYHSGAPFGAIDRYCRRTGGAWLVDRCVDVAGRNARIYGLSARKVRGRYVSVDTRGFVKKASAGHSADIRRSRDDAQRGSGPARNEPGPIRICLVHYPLVADWLTERFDLILAGHSHGGQVRLPGVGPLLLPRRVGEYDMGLFRTANGPLYVNPGIGVLWNFRVRFLCPPELTVIEL